MNFTPVPAKEAETIEAGARERGLTKKFFNQLNEWYDGLEEKPDPCIIYLNKDKDDFFFGKKTASLYTNLNTAMGEDKLDQKGNWRLIKRGDNLCIARL